MIVRFDRWLGSLAFGLTPCRDTGDVGQRMCHDGEGAMMPNALPGRQQRENPLTNPGRCICLSERQVKRACAKWALQAFVNAWRIRAAGCSDSHPAACLKGEGAEDTPFAAGGIGAGAYRPRRCFPVGRRQPASAGSQCRLSGAAREVTLPGLPSGGRKRRESLRMKRRKPCERNPQRPAALPTRL